MRYELTGRSGFRLSKARRGRSDEASAIELGFSHDCRAADGVRRLVLAGTYDPIDKHRG